MKKKRTVKLLAGITIGLALTPAAQTVFADANNNEEVYTVKAGDTLGKISKRLNISINSLVKTNKIKNKNIIFPGQQLKYNSSTPGTEVEDENSISNDLHNNIKRKFKEQAQLPIDAKYYEMSAPFGERSHPITTANRFHNGMDIAANGINKKKVRSVLDGIVVHSSYNEGGYGHYVLIQHAGFRTLYAHMAEPAIVETGDPVKAGDKIGNVGNTGNSTGPHLHFEIEVEGKKIDPKPFLDVVVNSSDKGKESGAMGGEDEKVPSESIKKQKVHTVHSGDTVNRIARKYKTTTANIVNWNNLKNANLIIVGQKLIVGEGNKANDERLTESSYKVVSGDSLWRISRKYGTTVKRLKEINGLTSDLIFVGQLLIVG